MKKSICSLMLFDEIVEQIDQMAYERGTNRSQLINDILADYLGIKTPEQKVQQILEQLSDNLRDTLSVSQINKNSSIQFGKSLKYKYRPKIRYSYEFVNDDSGRHAVLKVSSRTKSEDLNEHFDQFFEKIESIEAQAVGQKVRTQEKLSNHKFIREFREGGSVDRDVDQVTGLLSDYLRLIDTAMNLYFEEDGGDFDQQIRRLYLRFEKAHPTKK